MSPLEALKKIRDYVGICGWIRSRFRGRNAGTMQKFFVTIGRLEHDENTCNKEVYERGYLVGVWDKSQEEATNHWHYFGGRVVIKRLNK